MGIADLWPVVTALVRYLDESPILDDNLTSGCDRLASRERRVVEFAGSLIRRGEELAIRIHDEDRVPTSTIRSLRGARVDVVRREPRLVVAIRAVLELCGRDLCVVAGVLLSVYRNMSLLEILRRRLVPAADLGRHHVLEAVQELYFLVQRTEDLVIVFQGIGVDSRGLESLRELALEVLEALTRGRVEGLC